MYNLMMIILIIFLLLMSIGIIWLFVLSINYRNVILALNQSIIKMEKNYTTYIKNHRSDHQIWQDSMKGNTDRIDYKLSEVEKLVKILNKKFGLNY